jgi:hypothetical protein
VVPFFLEGCDHGIGRDISPELESYFARRQQQIAYLILIEPKGKPAEGYTSWDSDIVYNPGPRPWNPGGGNITFRRIGSAAPTEVPASLGLSTDSTDVSTLLRIGGVTKARIMTGYYRDALATIYQITPEHLDYGDVVLTAGRLGKCEFGDSRARFELVTWSELLNRPLGRTTNTLCQWEFMRGHCRNNVDGFGEPDPDALDDGPKPTDAGKTMSGTLESVYSRSHLKVAGIVGKADGWANFGRLRITSGDYESAEFEIKRWKSTGEIWLNVATPFPLEEGVDVEVEEGCEHTWPACIAKNNTDNFGGQPFLPPEERLGKVKKKEKDDDEKKKQSD